MISLTTYVLILLAMSGVSMYFIIHVLSKQVRLLKVPFSEEYDEQTRKVLVHFRYVLFIISLTIIIMGLIPVAINVLTLLVDTGRPHRVGLVSIVYSFTVHFQALMLSYLVSRLYRLAANEKEITDYTQRRLETEIQDQNKA